MQSLENVKILSNIDTSAGKNKLLFKEHLLQKKY